MEFVTAKPWNASASTKQNEYGHTSSGSVTLKEDALNGYPVLAFQSSGVGANAQMEGAETSRFSGLVSSIPISPPSHINTSGLI